MKKFVLLILFILVCSVAQAQCVAEVKDVLIDDVRGSIIVETQYKMNGTVVDARGNPDPNAVGRTRYLETTGTKAEIVTKAKADIGQHCDNLIIREAVRVNDLNAQKLLIQKAQTEPMIADLKTNAVGWTKTVDTKVIQYKNKEITINADGSYSSTTIPYDPTPVGP